MTDKLPSRAQVVVVGGGVVGCSVAYHLTKRGWSDVVLLERKSLTSGTTWHAAGLITLARPTHGTRAIVQRSLEVFQSLEAETGLGTGWRRTGTLHTAMNGDRWEELLRQASAHRSSDVKVEVVDADRAVDLFPLLNPEGLVGALHYPQDGRGNATDTTMALAKGARMGGAQVFENITVTDVMTEADRAVGIRTEQGDIEAEYVVNCTGMWGREFGAKASVDLPLQALAHYYIVTDNIPDLPSDMPTIKSADDWSYVKDEAGNLMVGFFEPGSVPWMSRGIPADAEFATLPEDWDHLLPFYEQMVERVPVLADAGIRLFFSGPESFTPDGLYYLGEVPRLRNYYAACGFNSVGFLSGPGAGQVLADWIVDGHAPLDVPELDPRRAAPHQVNRRYLEQRVVETLDLAYAMHWPYQQRSTVRGIRRSPLHDDMASAGAVWGEVAGWERTNWFAPAGTEPHYDHSYGPAKWFEHWAAEHRAVREQVGIFDLSSFGKIRVQGRDSLALLQRLSAGDVDVEPGRTVYTQWLNDRAGIEADVTVTRVEEHEWLVLTAAGTLGREMDRLRKHIGDAFVTISDASAGLAMMSVMGTRARDLLQPLTDTDLSNEAFAFGASQVIDIGATFARATRLTYVGELGWELLVPADQAVHVYRTIAAAGGEHGLRNVGYHALNSLRLEKAYRSWGHDIGWEDSPVQAGLGFAVAWDKPGGFIGRDALQRQRDEGVRRRLVQFRFDDPEVLAYHDEPIYRDGVRVGKVASTSYGWTLGASVALGYVGADHVIDADWVTAGTYEVEVANARYAVTPSLRPMYDPTNTRVRA